MLISCVVAYEPNYFTVRDTLGVGPAGVYVAALTPDRRSELRERCRRLLPGGPVQISATAWAATCRV